MNPVHGALLMLSIAAVAVAALSAAGSFPEHTLLRQNLAAVFINDSNVVEFVGTAENPPPVSGVGATTEPPPAGSSSGSIPGLNVEEPNDPAGSAGNSNASGESPAPAVGTVIVSSEPSGGSAGDTGQDAPQGGAGTALTVEDLFTALIGSGAVLGLEPASGGGGGGGILTLYGDRIREAFKLRDIAAIEIPGRRELLANHRAEGVAFSRSDFALFVSSAILADEYLDEVRYFSGTLSIRYQALGRLLGFAPVRYPIRVEASFQSGAVGSLTVKFPWYSFFLAKGITKDDFTAQLKSAISEEIDGFAEEYDVATHAFIAAGDTLSLTLGGF